MVSLLQVRFQLITNHFVLEVMCENNVNKERWKIMMENLDRTTGKKSDTFKFEEHNKKASEKC